jgi:hypothetical protein
MQTKGPAAISRDEAFDNIWKSFVQGLGFVDGASGATLRV